MKQVMMMIVALLAACGDTQGGGWRFEETSEPTPEESRETPNETPDPHVDPQIPPEAPEPVEPVEPVEPIELDESDNAECESPRHLVSGERISQTLDGLQATYNCLGWEMRQRYYEVTVPPHHRGWIHSYDMVVYRHGGVTPANPNCTDFAPRIGSDCLSDYVNRTESPQTYLVAATEYEGRVGEDFTIAYDAVPIDLSATCEQRVRLTEGQSYVWDMRGGYDDYNPCQIIEGHNAFYFHVEFPPDTNRLKVSVSTLEPNFPIRPSIQVVDDMIAQHYPQCSRSEFAMENGECIALDDSYFRASGPAEVVIERPEGFFTDPRASYLVIVNAGGWNVPSGDARMEMRVDAVN